MERTSHQGHHHKHHRARPCRSGRHAVSIRTPIITINTTEGRTYAVRYLPVGARYGTTHSSYVHAAPLVEFWDATLADDGPAGPIGLFVCRYPTATLLDTNGYRFRVGGPFGLTLDDGTPGRRLDERALTAVRVWIMTMQRHSISP